MTDTFTPPACPNVGSSVDVELRTRSAEFGDGYSQRSADGLNAIGRTLNLEWPKLSKTEAQEIVTFLETKGGAEAFLYQAPKDAAARQWICQRFRRVSTSNRNAAVNATFKQVNDL